VPFDVRVALSALVAEGGSGFADDLEQALECQADGRIVLEGAAAPA
jgi:hypothetical protein